ncbi:MAG: glycerophosphodiester phosphodiesterase [Bacteroidales bacterium]|nr:glycerophosphodiester phosphodiesterase [Bacteroidales bacterium]
MKKTFCILLALVSLGLSASAQGFYAHRAGRAENDENTLQAFKQCLSVGVDRFETDIRMAADGTLIISHDANLKRRTGFDGVIEQMKGKDIIKKKTYLGNRIPSAKALVKLLASKKASYVEFELKTGEKNLYPDSRIPEYCEAIYALVSKYQPQGVRWVYTSFDHRPLIYLREHHPEVLTGLINAKPVSKDLINLAKKLGVNQLDAGVKGTTAKAVEAAHKEGLRVCLWPGAKPQDYYDMKALGADAMCTDIPNLLRLELSGK